jgi:hypothetical protein
MNKNYKLNFIKHVIIFAIFAVSATGSFAQKVTEVPETQAADFVTYQGRLTAGGAPANGSYDFQFTVTDGNGNVIQTVEALGVSVSNGIFTTRLVFNFSTFVTKAGVNLQIGVRQLPTEPYALLGPPQPFSATPYAFQAHRSEYADYSGNSLQLNGVPANQYVVTGDSRLSDAREPLPGSLNYVQNTTDLQSANFNISGTGTAALLSALSINSALQYSLGGAKFITAPTVGNTFVGLGVGAFLSSGQRNSFFGNNAGKTTADGSDNAFFGFEAGKLNVAGSGNTFFGSNAGTNNAGASYNSFQGYRAGMSVTEGNGNSFFGAEAGIGTTVGSTNAFFGQGSGYSNTTGSNNAYFGAYSGRLGFETQDNAFFGAYAGNNNIGSSGTFVGGSAGFNNKGNNNSFVGFESGYANTTGQSNSFVGFRSGRNTTVGSSNTFVGFGTGTANANGNGNVFVGSQAGANSAANDNTFIGRDSGLGMINGSANVAVGAEAGKDNASGSNNIFIGSRAGLGSKSGSDNIFIGANQTVGDTVTNTVVIGNQANAFIDNAIVLGNSSQRTIVRGFLHVQTWETGGQSPVCAKNQYLAACSSSIRYKKDVLDFTPGLDVVRRLRPVSFRWKSNDALDLGFIAEEVNSVEPLLTTYNDQGTVEGVKYDRITTALVNAVNEQQKQIEGQKTKLDQQETMITDQRQSIASQQAQIEKLERAVIAIRSKAQARRRK